MPQGWITTKRECAIGISSEKNAAIGAKCERDAGLIVIVAISIAPLTDAGGIEFGKEDIVRGGMGGKAITSGLAGSAENAVKAAGDDEVTWPVDSDTAR